jgi:hypothetical protein
VVNQRDVQKVLLGEALVGFKQVIQQLTTEPPLSAHWTVWVSDPAVLPKELSDQVELWVGEVEQSVVEQWCWEPAHPDDWQHLGRNFGLITVFPYLPRIGLIEAISRTMVQRHGVGGWVDLDWGMAPLSLSWAGRHLARDTHSIWPSRVVKAGEIDLVPAWAPWRVGTPTVAMERVAVLSQHWAWHGWDLGARFLRPETLTVLSQLDSLVLWIGEVPRFSFALKESVEMIQAAAQATNILAVAKHWSDEPRHQAWIPKNLRCLSWPGLDAQPLALPVRSRGRRWPWRLT